MQEHCDNAVFPGTDWPEDMYVHFSRFPTVSQTGGTPDNHSCVVTFEGVQGNLLVVFRQFPQRSQLESGEVVEVGVDEYLQQDVDKGYESRTRTRRPRPGRGVCPLQFDGPQVVADFIGNDNLLVLQVDGLNLTRDEVAQAAHAMIEPQGGAGATVSPD